MTREELNSIFENTVQECKKIMFSKNIEYGKNNNVLENFDSASSKADIDILKVWYVYCCKHINSLESYIREGKVFSDEAIENRINDVINYMIILRALIDRNKNKKEHGHDIIKDKILLEGDHNVEKEKETI